MKNTPFIYIYLFLTLVQPTYSQAKKVLIISGSEINSDRIIQQIDYNKIITHDSIYFKEIKNFRNKLDQLGFIQHFVDSVSKNDSLYYIRFNLSNAIKKIRIYHPDIITVSKIVNYKIKKRETYIEIPFIEFSLFMNKISEHYQNNGFAFINIKLINLKKNNSHLSGFLKIDKNKKRTIDKIIVKGYTNFPKTFINRKFNLHSGDLYDKNKIARIPEECNTIDFVSEIKSPELLYAKDSTVLYLYLKRERSNYFDGIIGFSSSKEKKRIQLYGNIDLKIKNALNTGESIKLKWLSNQNKAKTLDLTLKTPYIFKTAFSTYYKLNIHKQDTLFSSISNLLGADYRITKNQDIGFIIERLQSNKTTLLEQSEIRDFNSFFYGTTYTYSKPYNHVVFNTKTYLNSQVSQGNRNGLTQYKISNKLHYLLILNNKNNILFKNTTEILLSKDYIKNELFRIGGSQSIRGFDENNFLSTGYSYLNTEYNYLTSPYSFLSGIFDLGVVNNKLLNTTSYLYSFGIGFSQKTKMGQLGIQYFIGNTNTSPFSFSNSKLHLSVSQNF